MLDHVAFEDAVRSSTELKASMAGVNGRAAAYKWSSPNVSNNSSTTSILTVFC